MTVRTAPTHELGAARLRSVREMLDLAFEGNFDGEDWDHTLGGFHAWIEDERGSPPTAPSSCAGCSTAAARTASGTWKGSPSGPTCAARGSAER